jgi:hypothetical protein
MRRVRSLFFFIIISTAALACNEAPLIAAPDAGATCQRPIPIFPCHAQEGGAPGCSPDLQSFASLGQEVVIGPGTYEAGCAVQVNSGTLDSDNQCMQLGTCNCTQDAGSFSWVCYP